MAGYPEALPGKTPRIGNYFVRQAQLGFNSSHDSPDQPWVSDRFRVPKTRVPAEVRTLLGERRVWLFLAESAAMHSGSERPSDVLNCDGEFLVFEDDSDAIVVVRLDAILVVGVWTDVENDDYLTQGVPTTELAVSVLLEDGSRVNGAVRYRLPEANRRLQDLLNQPERFIAIHSDDGARVSLVNKSRIVEVVAD